MTYETVLTYSENVDRKLFPKSFSTRILNWKRQSYIPLLCDFVADIQQWHTTPTTKKKDLGAVLEVPDKRFLKPWNVRRASKKRTVQLNITRLL